MRRLFCVVVNSEARTTEAATEAGEDPAQVGRDRNELCLTSQRCVLLTHPKTVAMWNKQKAEANKPPAQKEAEKVEAARLKAVQKAEEVQKKAAETDKKIRRRRRRPGWRRRRKRRRRQRKRR
jgi:hypothetical protein